MHFLIDANLPRAVIAVVQNLGHLAEFARDIGLASATDEQIANMHCDIMPRCSLGTWTLRISVDIRLIGTQVLSFCVCRTPLWRISSQPR
jgi:hypothetical protein